MRIEPRYSLLQQDKPINALASYEQSMKPWEKLCIQSSEIALTQC